MYLCGSVHTETNPQSWGVPTILFHLKSHHIQGDEEKKTRKNRRLKLKTEQRHFLLHPDAFCVLPFLVVRNYCSLTASLSCCCETEQQTKQPKSKVQQYTIHTQHTWMPEYVK